MNLDNGTVKCGNRLRGVRVKSVSGLRAGPSKAIL